MNEYEAFDYFYHQLIFPPLSELQYIGEYFAW